MKPQYGYHESPYKNHLRIINNINPIPGPFSPPSHHPHRQDSESKRPRFDRLRHTLLCSELKHLYTAMTRTKHVSPGGLGDVEGGSGGSQQQKYIQILDHGDESSAEKIDTHMEIFGYKVG